ncbi:MAG: acyltransferase [Phycisphaerae bacterium]
MTDSHTQNDEPRVAQQLPSATIACTADEQHPTHSSQPRYARGGARELIVQAAALGPRLFGRTVHKWRRLCWAAALRANVRQVGPCVYLYGPARFLGTRNVHLGGHGNLYDNVLFETIEEGVIEIGDNFRINRGCLISAHLRVSVGDDCLIGEYVSIRDNNHRFDDAAKPVGEQGYRSAPVSIGDDVWIGRGVAVLPGVTIGQGAVIAANAVVTKDIPALEVWAGVPARFLRRRGGGDLPC